MNAIVKFEKATNCYELGSKYRPTSLELDDKAPYAVVVASHYEVDPEWFSSIIEAVEYARQLSDDGYSMVTLFELVGNGVYREYGVGEIQYKYGDIWYDDDFLAAYC